MEKIIKKYIDRELWFVLDRAIRMSMLTQKEFAKQIGYSASRVSLIISNKKIPPARMLAQMGLTYNLSGELMEVLFKKRDTEVVEREKNRIKKPRKPIYVRGRALV